MAPMVLANTPEMVRDGGGGGGGQAWYYLVPKYAKANLNFCVSLMVTILSGSEFQSLTDQA